MIFERAHSRFSHCAVVEVIVLLLVLASCLAVGPSTTPATQADAFTAARQLAAHGDHRAALAKYADAIKSQPNNGLVYAYRALSRLELSQMVEAQQDVDQAIRLAEKDPITWEAAGQLKIVQNQTSQGTALFDKAAGLSPKTAGAIYTDLAAALSALNNPKLARDIESALKSAAQADPPSPEALFQLGQSYANDNRPEGRDYLKRYLALTAKLPEEQQDPQKIQLAKQLIRALDLVQSLGK